jgi:hypothetical protein
MLMESDTLPERRVRLIAVHVVLVTLITIRFQERTPPTLMPMLRRPR